MKKILNNILKIFEKKSNLYECYYSDLRNIFSIEKFKYYKGNSFPIKYDLIHREIYAYKFDLMITENDFLKLKEIILNHFKLDFAHPNRISNIEGINKKIIVNEGIAIAITNEFDGIVAYLMTNNVDLLTDIDLAEFTPPPPWVVFPDEDPRGLGSMQGSMDFWFLSYWDPFWNNLTFAKKRQYLKKTKPNKYWNYYLMVNPYYTRNSIENKQNIS